MKKNKTEGDKMIDGFRKSILGFNKEDVINYIDEIHKFNNEKTAELKEKIDTLKNQLDELNAKLAEAESAKEMLEIKLSNYNEKKKEIDMLSESIGKLYLVAKANSNAIMENAEESKKAALEEIAKNFSSLEAAHTNLTNLKKSVQQNSDNFGNEVETLISSLSDARSLIGNKSIDSSEKSEEFEKLLASVK